MKRITYEVVRHDTAWAYKVGDVYSETFATHEQARLAAEDAARRQRLEGETTAIEYEDENGAWHEEITPGNDQPETAVADEIGLAGDAGQRRA